MELWVERFRDHPVWSALAEVRARINAISIPPDAPGELRALAYHGAVLEDIEGRRADADPLFINSPMLSKLQSALENWHNALTAVEVGSRTLESSVPEVEQVVTALASWPPVRPGRYFSGAWRAASAYQEKAEELLADFDSQSEALKAKLKTVSDSTDNLQSAVATEKQRISEAIAEFTTSSKSATEAALKDVKSDADEAFRAIEAQLKEMKQYSTDSVAYLTDLKSKAAETVNAATSEVVATDYGKYARNKTLAAWITDVAAAAVGIVGVAAILVHLYNIGEAVDDISVSITRLAASLGTVGLAALIGRRAAQHHAEARAAKRTDLAIRRVLPFIASLDPDEQRAIVLEVSERVFIDGRLEPEHKERKSSLADRIKEVTARRVARQSGSQEDQVK